MRTDSRVADTIADQDGLITRGQALACGMSKGAIRHRLAVNRWRIVLPGIYASQGGEFTPRQRLRAGILLGGDTAQLAADTACRLRGVRYLPAFDGFVRVVVDHDVRRVSEGFVVVQRSARLPPAVQRSGLPVTPVARAVIDAARTMRSLRDVRAIVADVVQRRLTTPSRLATEISDGGSAESALPRRAVEEVLKGLRSAPEGELRDVLLSSAVLPEPGWNAPVFDANGRLIAVADGLWRAACMIGEVNSREHHFFGETWEATMRRHARLAAAGFLVIPVSPQRLRRAPAEVLREFEDAYTARLTTFVQR
jgi:hypothetical protein